MFKNEITLQGVVQAQLPLQSGVSQSGKQWTKNTAMINTGDKEPVVISAFNQNGTVLGGIQPGSALTIIGKLASREWQGKHFIDFRITSVFPTNQGQPVQSAALHGVVDHQVPNNPLGQQPAYQPPVNNPTQGLDDIPF